MVKLEFDRELKQLRAAVEAGEDVAPVLKARRKDWQKLYVRLYLSVGADFADRTAGKFKSSGPSLTKADEWQRLVLEYLRRTSGEKIRGIEQTTLGLVRQALAEGVEAGEGTDQLSQRVADSYGMMKGYRSERISRTEVVCASERGSISSARSTGLDLTKDWLTTRDGREREWHGDVDGQTRGLDEAFDVNGEQLDHPGDTSLGASADNIVNCRCTTVFQTAG